MQLFFFRLVGILARTSPAGNAYAPLFFAASIFLKLVCAFLSHRQSVNCRERGATLIFSLRLLVDSGIYVACSLRDRLPGIVTKVFAILAWVWSRSARTSYRVAARNPSAACALADLSSPRSTKWHEMLVFLYTYRLPSANNPE